MPQRLTQRHTASTCKVNKKKVTRKKRVTKYFIMADFADAN